MTKVFDMQSVQDSEDLFKVIGKLQLAVEASRMGVWEFDESTGRVHWDDRMLEIYGITDGQNDRPDDFWEKHIHPEDLPGMRAYEKACKENNTDFKHDYRIVRDDGTIRHIRSLARQVSAPGQPSKLVGVNIDVTEDYLRTEELRKARDQLKHDARHDALTGLGNRRRLDDVMLGHFAKVSEADRYCLLLFDLDHFKQVNDSLGHLAGDVVLKSTSASLVSVVGDRGVPFRMGGDEFAVFFPEAPDETEIVRLCEALIDRITAPIEIQGEECAVGVSIGYAYGEGPPDNPSDLITDADTALYAAKRRNGSGYQGHRSNLERAFGSVSNTRMDILNAMRRDELVCHFQPQFDATTLDIVGAEALVRWECPERGLMMPDAFLPQAIASGLIQTIDEHVLGLVVRQQTEWHRAGMTYPTVSVNTSFERLRDPDLAGKVSSVLAPHVSVAFELLETAMLDALDDVSRVNLDLLRRIGIRIALDDFGSGHSSVAALQAIRPERVKIDRTLVAPLLANPKQIMTLEALARIARLEGAGVVVEGMENGMQLAAIRSVDCDVLQGYALQRPIPADEFAALLTRRARLSA